MKKSFITKLAISTILTFALFTNISCSNLISDSTQETVQNNSEKVLIQPAITSASRSVFPDVTLEKLENIALSYKAGTSNATIAVYDNYETFKNTVIALDPDYYAFTLQAKCGAILLKAEIEEKEYKASAATQALEFELKYSLTDKAFTEGYGDLSYTFTYEKDKEITEASIKLYKYESNGTLPTYTYNTLNFNTTKVREDGTHYVEYNLKNVPAGIYEIQLELKTNDKKYAFYKNSIYIADGCSTTESYNVSADSWVNKYVLNSLVYTNISEHLKAESENGSIKITLTIKENEPAWNDIKIIDEDSRITIKLEDWQENFPRTVGEYVTYFPFTKKNQYHIFRLVRNQYRNGSVYDDSEVIMIKSTSDGLNILDDDYYNKLSRMGITASPDTFEVKLDYDWRKLFNRVDDTIFSSFTIGGQVVAGNKSWNGNETVNCEIDENGEKVLKEDGTERWHYGLGDFNVSWDTGNIDLLTEEGKKRYSTLLSGFSIVDPVTIKNCQKLGSYFVNSSANFRIKGLDVYYGIDGVESEVTTAPTEERVTVTFHSINSEPPFAKSYVKGKVVEVTEPRKGDRRFLGWCKNADCSDEPAMQFEFTENTDLYAKNNLYVNNWNYVNYNDETQKNNYYTHLYFNEVNPEFKTTVNGSDPIIVALKGTVVNKFSGTIRSHIVDYSDKYKTEWGMPDNWEVKANGEDKTDVSYDKGDYFCEEFRFIPSADVHPYFADGNPAMYISATASDPRDVFELTDWSYEVIQNPKKVTLIYNYPAGHGQKSETYYYKTGDDVILPTDFSEKSLVVNSWYDNADLEGTPVTSIEDIDEDKTYYAKMDIKLAVETWSDFETGDKTGHYIAQFDMAYLAFNLHAVDKTSLPPNTVENFSKGKKIKLTFTGTPKYDFHKEFFLQIFDTENAWVNSINYVWFDEICEAGQPVTFKIVTEITQTQFQTVNPVLYFGYNHDITNGNDKENYFSDWSIFVESITEDNE